MPDGDNVIGMGVYTVQAAARLTRVPPARIRAWVFGQGGQPTIIPELDPVDGQEALSFVNLIEVLFLRDLRGERVSLQAIRRMAEIARLVLAAPHPFATHRFHTDGRTIFIETARETLDRSLVNLSDGNGAMLEVLERSFRRSVAFKGVDGMASAWQPSDALTRIVLDPRRQFGQPIDRESGVPTEVLAAALKAEQGNVDRVASWWEVPVEAVREAAEFEMLLHRRQAA